MSGNSSSQGASGMNTPVLPGYTVTWDYDRRQWAASSNTGETVLYGADQRELEHARNRLVTRLADDLKPDAPRSPRPWLLTTETVTPIPRDARQPGRHTTGREVDGTPHLRPPENTLADVLHPSGLKISGGIVRTARRDQRRAA